MLYTTKEIADMYGGEGKNVTPYMITHTWIPNGLKHVRGKGQGFLYKKEWIDEYLELQTMTFYKEEKKAIRMNSYKTKSNKKCFVV